MILFMMILISKKIFWPNYDFFFNNIDVLSLLNYIILKIVHPEQYIKRLIEESQQFGCILFVKMKVSFVHYKLCWHLVVKVWVSVSLSISINIKVSLLALVSIKFKRYAALCGTKENLTSYCCFDVSIMEVVELQLVITTVVCFFNYYSAPI